MQFVMGHRHAVGGTRTGQAHQMFGADIRRENRSANNPPAQIAAGQKIIVRRVTALAESPTMPKQTKPRSRVLQLPSPIAPWSAPFQCLMNLKIATERFQPATIATS